MKLLRVAGATLNQTPLDWNGNRDRIRQILLAAKSAGVELLCLPELAISGYGCEDFFLSITTTRTAEQVLRELLPDTRGITVLIGLPVYFEGAAYNGAAMVQDGRVLGVNLKKLLPREGVHYEQRWFRPWAYLRVEQFDFCGASVPIGDLWYQLGDVGVGIEVCEEAWGAKPGAAHFADGLDIVLNSSASHFALGKYKIRERLVANSSRSMAVHYVYTNLVGVEAGRVIYDGGVLIAESGDIVARGRRFGFTDGEITAYDLNLDLARVAKMRQRAARDEKQGGREQVTGSASHLVPVRGVSPIQVPGVQRVVKSPSKPIGKIYREVDGGADRSDPSEVLRHEFLDAQVLGLFDYLRKSRAKGYVLSLSGGCDSSCCAVLIAHMVAMALAELGPEQMGKRLGLGSAASGLGSDPRVWVRSLLTCLYQTTENSGPQTSVAAAELAREIGAACHVVDVQPAVDFYRKTTESILHRQFKWDTDDLVLQNIQARARAPMAWTVANALGALLLTTSNRSEAAVGYATMDGDTAGGLAPLAGIDKQFLRGFLRWAETDCQRGLGPLASLSFVNSLAPTAELRPASAKQTDEADLMPYEVLERIERLLIRDKLHPKDILACLIGEFSGYDPALLLQWVDKFLTLWCQSQWKRDRFAPSFHLDDESLDPKTWCRFPIFSGNFDREKTELY